MITFNLIVFHNSFIATTSFYLISISSKGKAVAILF